MSASLPGTRVPILSSSRVDAAPAIVAISMTCRDVRSCGSGNPPGLLSGKARSLASARCRQKAPRINENGSVVMFVSTSGLRLGRIPWSRAS